MKDLIQYLLQSSATLMVLYGVYWLFLKSETFFSTNRLYLIGSALISLLIPFFRFNFNHLDIVRSAVIYLDPILITPDRAGQLTSGHLQLAAIIGYIYFTGIVFFSIRFAFQFLQLCFIVNKQGFSKDEKGMNIVYLDQRFSSFSFFNFVFLSVPDKNKRELTAILDHESVHVNQLHSLDLLIMETLKIILWFNPFAWLMGKSVKTIHEFLADEGVLRRGYNTYDYQYLLLHLTSGIRISGLSNNFNFSLLKTRIIMMTKSRSAIMARAKVLYALPALVALVFFFSLGTVSNLAAQDKPNTETKKPVATATVATPQKQVQEKPAKEGKTKDTELVFSRVEKQPEYPGGDEARIKFLVENIKYPAEAMKSGIQGKVFVTFMVNSDGTISDVKILRGIGGVERTPLIRRCISFVLGILYKFQNPNVKSNPKP